MRLPVPTYVILPQLDDEYLAGEAVTQLSAWQDSMNSDQGVPFMEYFEEEEEIGLGLTGGFDSP